MLLRRTLAGLTLSLLLAGCQTPPGGNPSPTSSASPGSQGPASLAQELAVVDGAKLLEAHPDYEKLRDLDKEFQRAEDEVREIPLREVMGLREKGTATFRTALEQAKAEMEGEKAAISAEMSGLAQALQGKAEAELTQVKAELDLKMKDYVKSLGPEAQPDTGPADTPQTSLNEYQRNLQLMAQRSMTARRLEIEKAAANDLAAERSRLDQQLAAYEDEVSMRYQEEKLNLQLKMQNNPSEEVEKTTRERLNQIDDEVAAAKAEKRKEIEAAMESFHSSKQAESDRELARYESNLKDELQRKFPRPVAVEAPRPRPGGPPPEIRKKIEEFQSTMAAEMSRRKAELEGQMKAKEAEARARLEEKSRQVSERLKSLEEQLKHDIEERSKHLSKAGQAKLDKAKAHLEKVKTDRKAVYDKILADLDKAVGKVAVKKGVLSVISVDPNSFYQELTDLTDLSLVEVKQIGSP